MVELATEGTQFTTIGSFNEKIITRYQPNFENIGILDQYQTQILLLLFLEGTAKCSTPSLSFQGIKRKLDLHQQILTNALNRLLEKKLILKSSSDNHYFLTKEGLDFIQSNSSNMTDLKLNSTMDLPTIENIYITNISADNFLNTFLGKWFGDFRWIGWFQDANSVKLEWISTDNSVEAIAWHGNSTNNSESYIIKIIIFQKSPTITAEEFKQKANLFKYYFNKKLAKTATMKKEFPIENPSFQLDHSKNNLWFYQSCVN